MSKTLLIHGFAIGLTAPFIRRPFGPSAGFSAWDKQVIDEEITYLGVKGRLGVIGAKVRNFFLRKIFNFLALKAPKRLNALMSLETSKSDDSGSVVFHWGITRRVNPFRLFDPFLWRDHYEDEKFLAQAAETFERLQIFLEKEKPAVIVCHSMGCFLLNEFCKNFVLPTSVRTIVLIQSDLSTKEPLNFLTKDLSIYNVYCPWDSTLLLSAIYNRSWRVGLGSVKIEGVKNIFFPLFRSVNLHMSSIRDSRLVELVDSIIK